MKIVIEFNADKLISEVMQNYPEASAGGCMKCVMFNYQKNDYEFLDSETGKTYKLNMNRLKRGMKVLLKEIKDGKLPGLLINLSNFRDSCEWDAYSADHLVQAACFGKTIYG